MSARVGCPSCDRDLSYPGAPGHVCYTYAEQAAAIRATELAQLRAVRPPSLPCPKPFTFPRVTVEAHVVAEQRPALIDVLVASMASHAWARLAAHPAIAAPWLPQHLWDAAVRPDQPLLWEGDQA